MNSNGPVRMCMEASVSVLLTYILRTMQSKRSNKNNHNDDKNRVCIRQQRRVHFVIIKLATLLQNLMYRARVRSK